jgi:hypothetical protein
MHPQAHPQMTAAAQQHFAMQNSLMQQQRREGMKGHCLLKLMQFSEHLSSYEPVSHPRRHFAATAASRVHMLTWPSGRKESR